MNPPLWKLSGSGSPSTGPPCPEMLGGKRQRSPRAAGRTAPLLLERGAEGPDAGPNIPGRYTPNPTTTIL